MLATKIQSPAAESINSNPHQITFGILVFLWRWKLLSTAALSARFFPALKPHSAYKRLRALSEKGLITCLTNCVGRDFYWSLTQKGFQSIRMMLPPLKEVGFKSENHSHDGLVSAIHLGPQILFDTENLQSFSEQELRRVDPEFYPAWVPFSSVHRPDGYWRILDGISTKTIALEVELSFKKICDYHQLSKFYARYDLVTRVVWFCQSDSMAKRIHRLIQEPNSENSKQHSFFIVDDFKNFGWDSVCMLGADEGKSLHGLLGRTEEVSSTVPSHELLLDTRKYSTIFGRYSELKLTQKQLLSAPLA